MVSESVVLDAGSNLARAGDQVVVHWLVRDRQFRGVGLVVAVGDAYVRVKLTATAADYVDFPVGSEVKVPRSAGCQGWGSYNCAYPRPAEPFRHKDFL